MTIFLLKVLYKVCILDVFQAVVLLIMFLNCHSCLQNGLYEQLKLSNFQICPN